MKTKTEIGTSEMATKLTETTSIVKPQRGRPKQIVNLISKPTGTTVVKRKKLQFKIKELNLLLKDSLSIKDAASKIGISYSKLYKMIKTNNRIHFNRKTNKINIQQYKLESIDNILKNSVDVFDAYNSLKNSKFLHSLLIYIKPFQKNRRDIIKSLNLSSSLDDAAKRMDIDYKSLIALMVAHKISNPFTVKEPKKIEKVPLTLRQAAYKLGVSYNNIYYLMRHYDIVVNNKQNMVSV